MDGLYTVNMIQNIQVDTGNKKEKMQPLFRTDIH